MQDNKYIHDYQLGVNISNKDVFYYLKLPQIYHSKNSYPSTNFFEYIAIDSNDKCMYFFIIWFKLAVNEKQLDHEKENDINKVQMVRKLDT